MAWRALWLICGVGSAWLASTKGRSVAVWLLLGLLLGPLGLLLIGFAGPVQKTTVPQEQRTEVELAEAESDRQLGTRAIGFGLLVLAGLLVLYWAWGVLTR